jgi:hypothetical protein
VLNVYGAGALLSKGTEGTSSSKHLFNNQPSGLLAKKQDLTNIKQQINMVSNFAKNLQFPSKLKKPTSIANRNGEFVKMTLVPSPSQFVNTNL